jgi:hypothetical protein
MIFYLPKNKLEKALEMGIDPFSVESGRLRMKVGRLVGKLYSKSIIEEFKISNQEIEEFVNSYKSFFNLDNLHIKVVEGEEIRSWYYYKNYLQINSGTLWKSCMRYIEKQPFLDMYCRNPQSIKMLVMLQKDALGNLRVRARAILWQDVKTSSSTIKVMDRIYSVYDSDVYIFKKWARDNGYICKSQQNSKSQTNFEIDGQEVSLLCNIVIGEPNQDFYPYLDTFQFFNISSGVFYNYPSPNYTHVLNRANGFLENEPVDDDDDYDYDVDPPI